MCPQEALESILFHGRSRNRHHELFEDPGWKQLHQTAALIRSLRKNITEHQTHHTLEQLPNGDVKVCWFHPALNLKRTSFLTPQQWALVHDPRWSSSHRGDVENAKS
ncbi:MAG: hypothetical protein AAGJ35_05895 [Myxococcota bacterium]